MRIILDVDTGIDDALALALAVRDPDVSLEAVLTVAGNVDLAQVTHNTLRVLDWLGATDVPVVAGADGPLVRPGHTADYWHGVDGLGGARLPPPQRRAGDGGVEYLIERARAEPGEITLVCVGPLTNLALAVQRAPSIVDQFEHIVVMGGAVRPPGNITPVAEFNIYADPEAAAIVFEQAWPLTMVGLDVSQQVVLRADEVAGLDDSSPERALVREVTRELLVERGLESIALHDPLALGVAIDRSLVTTRRGAVRVETRGEFTRGQTVFDLRRNRPAPAAESNTHVCVDVDAQRFRARFFSCVLGISS